jgi:hypothetical protein
MSLAPLLPETGLVRLIYASRWGASVREDLHHVARAIVAHSIQNNRAVDVTGLLLVHGGWFVQALEGQADAVRAVFARIAADPRHFDVTVLASGSADQRLFSDWSMAERRLSTGDDSVLERLGLDEKFAPAQLDAERALYLMSAVGQMAQAA